MYTLMVIYLIGCMSDGNRCTNVIVQRADFSSEENCKAAQDFLREVTINKIDYNTVVYSRCARK